jgi:competence protein ComEA
MAVVPPRPTPPPQLLVHLGTELRGWLRWFGVGRIFLTGVAVAVTVIGGIWLIRAPDPEELRAAIRAEDRAASYLPVAPREFTLSSLPRTLADPKDQLVEQPGEEPENIFVHVVGAVKVPGVYLLAGDVRVVDALRAAGGPTEDAAVDAMNLAAFVSDGQRLEVPSVEQVRSGGYQPPASSSGAEPSQRVSPNRTPSQADSRIDINTAGVEELSRLPGIGPAIAAAIVADRIARGPFASVDELLRVRGIGQAKLEGLRTGARV